MSEPESEPVQAVSPSHQESDKEVSSPSAVKQPANSSDDEADALSEVDEDALSDLDEDQLNDEPLDQEVHTLKSHKRHSSERSSAPASTEKKRRPQRREAETEEQEEVEVEEPPVDEKTRRRREIEAKIDAALKPTSTRRKKLTGDDLEQLQDDTIAHLRDAMREAALEDVESIRKQQPALAKIKMLPEVTAVLRKNSLADSILDGNLLESVRVWLEPLPDASLPSFEIQKELFDALMQLPIKTIHLRESGLGKVVLFYTKSRRPHPSIKRAAEKLVGDWTRPIMGRSDNYRDRQVRSAVFDPNLTPGRGSPSAPESRRSLAEESAIRRGRAAIPTSNGVTYQVAPMSMASNNAATVRPSADSQLRRMKNKLMSSSRSKGSSKKGPSVEGNNLV